MLKICFHFAFDRCIPKHKNKVTRVGRVAVNAPDAGLLHFSQELLVLRQVEPASSVSPITRKWETSKTKSRTNSPSLLSFILIFFIQPVPYKQQKLVEPFQISHLLSPLHLSCVVFPSQSSN
eukprot:TRINITY_DN3638_c0_g1_i3.p1 TRINITY_DN3638_c0_g1~~TRINITY_DN3638_c0_g1_i3.p1  ORF type:complete len:122 (-),score=11.15 TRINITY_DN3638_c0_g1_i3:1005-1370(-)